MPSTVILQKIKDEITADPLARGYSGMTDAQIAADMSLANRDAEANPGDILKYLVLERFRTNDIADTEQLIIWGRLITISEAAIGSDPFGRGEGLVTLDHKCSALALIEIARGNITVAMEDSRMDPILSDMTPAAGGAGVMGASDRTALEAMSDNKQTRATEIGAGKARMPIVWVTQAKALP